MVICSESAYRRSGLNCSVVEEDALVDELEAV